MSSLADLPELVGFFSYSREDDEGSNGALTRLRERVWRELRGQLGRTRGDFRLWQDRAAIPEGRLWEEEIESAITESVFFIPIITPTSVRSRHCKREFEKFIARETELGRKDLIFPLLYIRIPALEDESLWRQDPVLRIIGSRQYIDWLDYRHLDIDSTEVGVAIERFCANIFKALHRPLASLKERRTLEEEDGAAQPAGQAGRQEAEVKQRTEEADRRKDVENEPRLEETRRNQEIEERQRVKDDSGRQEAEPEPPRAPKKTGSVSRRVRFVALVRGNRVLSAITAGAFAALLAAGLWLVPSKMLERFEHQATAVADPVSPLGSSSAMTSSEIREAWGQIKDTTNVALLEAFIRRFGDSWYADLARDRIQQLKKTTTRPTIPTISDTSCRKEGGLKSVEGRQPTTVTFRNSHGLSVRLYWLNYSAERKLYATISDGESYTQPTYVTHPWIVTDMADTCISLYLPKESASEFVVR